MALTDKQRGVRRGVIAGAAITLAVLAAALVVPPPALLPAPGVEAALRRALAWDALAVACLVAAIGRLARL